MTNKPTPEQIQRACDLVGNGIYTPMSYGPHNTCFPALADTIAQLDAMQAERDKARADLGEIDRHAVEWNWAISSTARQKEVAAIAAPYRVETDPLVAQFPALLNILHYHETGGHKGDGSDEALELARKELLNLAKRGLEIGRSA